MYWAWLVSFFDKGIRRQMVKSVLGIIGGSGIYDLGHRYSPSDINYRANIDILKREGVTDLVSLSACGSFKENLPPGTFVLVDQFVDRTYKRESSFFGRGWVTHGSWAN